MLSATTDASIQDECPKDSSQSVVPSISLEDEGNGVKDNDQAVASNEQSEHAGLRHQDTLSRRSQFQRQRTNRLVDDDGNSLSFNGSFSHPSLHQSSSMGSLMAPEVTLSSSLPSQLMRRKSAPRTNSWSHFHSQSVTDRLSRKDYVDSDDEAVRFPKQDTSSDSESDGLSFSAGVANSVYTRSSSYQPAQPHWFYFDNKDRWIPFSYKDNRALDNRYKASLIDGKITADVVVATDGNRYDVNLKEMTRTAIYWEGDVLTVRRCTWFMKGEGEMQLVPFSEKISQLLEDNYKSSLLSHRWNRRVALPNGDYVMFRTKSIMVYYRHSQDPINWTGEDSSERPKVVCRGVEEIEHLILEGESAIVDHLVFVVHGVGPLADLQGRSIFEAVDILRNCSLKLMSTHEFAAPGVPVGRVEFIPIEWHMKVRQSKKGINERLQSITLPSLSKLRHFGNMSMTDCLMYTSPVFCQKISETVVEEMNHLYNVFKDRNTDFNGKVSVCGHSLGSLILFDLLAGQTATDIAESDDTFGLPRNRSTTLLESKENIDYHKRRRGSLADMSKVKDILDVLGLKEWASVFRDEHILDKSTLRMCSEDELKEVGIPLGARKKIIEFLKSEQEVDECVMQRLHRRSSVLSTSDNETIEKERRSPDGKHMRSRLSQESRVKSIDTLGENGVSGTGQPLVMYPHLNFSPVHMFALGSPIAHMVTIRGVHKIGVDFQLPTCAHVFNIFHPVDPIACRMEPLINPDVKEPPKLMPHYKGRKRIHLEVRDLLTRAVDNLRHGIIEMMRNTWSSVNQFASTQRPVGTPDLDEEETVMFSEDEGDMNNGQSQDHKSYGKLNNGRRVDYVLQETPFESVNEYFAVIQSHTCYWSSEDTMLLILTEIYRSIFPSAYKNHNLPRFPSKSYRDEM